MAFLTKLAKYETGKIFKWNCTSFVLQQSLHLTHFDFLQFGSAGWLPSAVFKIAQNMKMTLSQ